MSKPAAMILGAALLAASSLAASRGAAGGACIPASVIAAQTDCAAAASPTVPVADVLAAASLLQSRAGTGRLPGGKSQRKGPVAAAAPRELDDAEKKQEALFHRFLCVARGAASGDRRRRKGLF